MIVTEEEQRKRTGCVTPPKFKGRLETRVTVESGKTKVYDLTEKAMRPGHGSFLRSGC